MGKTMIKSKKELKEKERQLSLWSILPGVRKAAVAMCQAKRDGGKTRKRGERERESGGGNGDEA